MGNGNEADIKLFINKNNVLSEIFSVPEELITIKNEDTMSTSNEICVNKRSPHEIEIATLEPNYLKLYSTYDDDIEIDGVIYTKKELKKIIAEAKVYNGDYT